MELKGMIGLEIHTYLMSNEKLFCKCPARREKGQKPNSYICPICTGQPGAKPMLPNESAVEKAVQIGLMMNCFINKKLVWMRKHYSWPDLPKGYQNTLSGSYALPIGQNGTFKGIKIKGLHLEEDPASWEPDSGKVDYNRSGLPLVEIVTQPDFSNSEEVDEWLKTLLHHLSYLKTVDNNAGIKVDVNVNINGKTKRTEIKNISSLDSIKKAIDYELKRHMLEGNDVQETRRFDQASGKTVKMRSKELAEDYRFLEDPDLITLNISDSMVDKIKTNMPESPERKFDKLVNTLKINRKDAEILCKDIDIVEFFEKLSKLVDSNFALPWVTVELLGQLNYHKKFLSEISIKPEHFANLLVMVKNGKITELQAKKTIMDFFSKNESYDPISNLKEKITDPKEIELIVRKVISQNKKAVEDYKKGENKSFNFLLGEVMKISEKRADFNIAKNILEKLI